MAPITDQTVNDLKAQVSHLEKRIWELEQRERGVKPVSASDAMRMILIGPPGAGKFPQVYRRVRLTRAKRQRHPGSQHQGKVLRLPFGMYFSRCNAIRS